MDDQSREIHNRISFTHSILELLILLLILYGVGFLTFSISLGFSYKSFNIFPASFEFSAYFFIIALPFYVLYRRKHHESIPYDKRTVIKTVIVLLVLFLACLNPILWIRLIGGNFSYGAPILEFALILSLMGLIIVWPFYLLVKMGYFKKGYALLVSVVLNILIVGFFLSPFFWYFFVNLIFGLACGNVSLSKNYYYSSNDKTFAIKTCDLQKSINKAWGIDVSNSAQPAPNQTR